MVYKYFKYLLCMSKLRGQHLKFLPHQYSPNSHFLPFLFLLTSLPMVPSCQRIKWTCNFMVNGRWPNVISHLGAHYQNTSQDWCIGSTGFTYTWYHVSRKFHFRTELLAHTFRWPKDGYTFSRLWSVSGTPISMGFGIVHIYWS
jgi:hypothetical protein